MQDFYKTLKETITMPFHIQASPGTVTEEDEVLYRCRSCFYRNGADMQNNTAKDLYKKISTEVILKATNIFHKCRKDYSTCYHVLMRMIHETLSDVCQTVTSWF